MVYFIGDKNEDETADMSDSDIESEADISELILVPDDSNTLHTMHTLKQCQALNPDPDDMISDEDDVYEDCDEGIEERNIIQNEINESRAESDTVENLTTRMQGNTMNIGYYLLMEIKMMRNSRC
ncbi:regulator of volume decrease after cellular swelling [Holotrichia oblita]|uniref:Regulator of volume decrease after cellular swelling n=1 Tax=Holotrichia oblita TaxID=644536 RepID=A0ACB9TSB1_HOLOL|nr:regulator of volume decrease after cellular swelling [Holotrichia oblita]